MQIWNVFYLDMYLLWRNHGHTETCSVCVSSIDDWMSASRLRLNPTKTEVMWFGASQQVSRINIGDIPMLSTTIKVVESVRDHGIILDAELTMSAHVTALCRSGFFQLRQLRPFTQSLTTEAAKTLVQSFISCRLDYCNSLLYGVTDNVMRRVQSLQNAAARLITEARRRDHITPVLCQLAYTGFLFGGEWSSNSPVWCARHCAVKCLSSWLMTSISSPKATDDPFGLPLITCARCHVRTR